MKDTIGMNGKVEVFKKYEDGTMEPLYEGKNAISYRAKAIMSRLLGGGLDPNTAPLYQFGSTPDVLRVTGMAFGNGGHLIYTTASKSTATLPYETGIVLNTSLTTAVSGKVGMPFISGTDWGYASQVDRIIPGTTYQKVENGNIPWDGTVNIDDNGPRTTAVTEPNTTLYSETFRVPLDAVDGVSYPTNTEVQFKATIAAANLNHTDQWGFAAQPANWISEIGLISGYCPTAADIGLNQGQVYSVDTAQPSGAGGYTYTTGAADTSNWGSGVATPWTSKDGSIGATNIPIKSSPPTVANGVDTFPIANRWNMVARKVLPVIPKTSSFSLVFIYTISY